VWWWGDATSRLMLLLAYLVTRSRPWEEARIRVVAAANGGTRQEAAESLGRTVSEARIEAEAHVVDTLDAATLLEESADAALVFIPFQIRQERPLDPFGGILDETVFTLPVCALVLAAEDIDLQAEPEEGRAGEMAEALDALADAEKRVRFAEKEFEGAAAAFESFKGKLQRMLAEPASVRDGGALQDLMKAVAAAEDKLGRAHRRFARERAKADDAAREAEAMGALPSDKDRKPEGPGN